MKSVLEKFTGNRTPESFRQSGIQVILDGKLVDPELAGKVNFILGEQVQPNEQGKIPDTHPPVVVKNVVVEEGAQLPEWYEAFVNHQIPIANSADAMIVDLQVIIHNVKDRIKKQNLEKGFPFLSEATPRAENAPTIIDGGILHPELAGKVNFRIVPSSKHLFDPSAPIKMQYCFQKQWHIKMEILDEDLPPWFRKFAVQINTFIFDEKERDQIFTRLEDCILAFCECK